MRVDGVLQAELRQLVRLPGPGAEAGAPEEPFRLGLAERPAVGRNTHSHRH